MWGCTPADERRLSLMCEGVERGGLEGKIVAAIMISEEKHSVLLDTGSGSKRLLFPRTEPTVLHTFDSECLDVCSCLIVFRCVRGTTTPDAAEPETNTPFSPPNPPPLLVPPLSSLVHPNLPLCPPLLSIVSAENGGMSSR
ncbi:unnamed protein product [Pleuronectes platessa]|uniref:Uncharacterized protein n=1 Tax=Pleuronectes platessa TaxID=8262 RepID=A0A9N7UEK4_PLEPL|nr:unnamed protein product [Pleuronectes platessa]